MSIQGTDTNEFRTPLAKPVGLRPNKDAQPKIYVPQSFPDAGKNGQAPKPKIWEFRPWELRFLDALLRGLEPADAYKDLGLTAEQGARLLKGKKAKEYIADRTRERMIAEGWTQEKWISEITKVWNGQKEVTREQMEAIKELGARVCPKPEKKTGGSELPQITINIGNAQSALRRQDAIDAEIVNGSKEGT